MNHFRFLLRAAAAAGLAAVLCAHAQTPEVTIRKNLSERVPQMGRIDEVTRTPMPGVYEVRVGMDLYYADAEGNHLIQGGQVIDVRQMRNLTEERVNKLSAVDFDALPLKDAFTIVRGNGKRKLALFQDPNCGYCKRFEADLRNVNNVTIHMFLYPILGPDSLAKSQNIWCARDKGQAWQDWMLRNVAAPAAPKPGCDTSAVDRNREFGRRHNITGTPTLFFQDGTRMPGAIPAAQVEKLLADASK